MNRKIEIHHCYFIFSYILENNPLKPLSVSARHNSLLVDETDTNEEAYNNHSTTMIDTESHLTET